MRDSQREERFGWIIRGAYVLLLVIMLAGIVVLLTGPSWTTLVGLLVAEGLIFSGARGLRRSIAESEETDGTKSA